MSWTPNLYDKVRIITGPHSGLTGYVGYIWEHRDGSFRFLIGVPFGRLCNSVWREQADVELIVACSDNQHVPQGCVA